MNSTSFTQKSGMNSFNDYLLEHSVEAKKTKANELYYHINVVIDAYTKGYNDGEKSAKKEITDLIINKAKEKFIEKANQVYLSTKSLVDIFSKNGYTVEKIYLNVFHYSPKVIVSINDNLLLNDDFVEFAYSKIHDIQCSFHTLFQSTLDISLISPTDLEEKLLMQDGFEYSEEF
ncbi:MAG: hypothetical protein U0T85_07490 [Cloacibacterium normanense]|jgi:hypothetical protein